MLLITLNTPSLLVCYIGSIVYAFYETKGAKSIKPQSIKAAIVTGNCGSFSRGRFNSPVNYPNRNR